MRSMAACLAAHRNAIELLAFCYGLAPFAG